MVDITWEVVEVMVELQPRIDRTSALSSAYLLNAFLIRRTGEPGKNTLFLWQFPTELAKRKPLSYPTALGSIIRWLDRNPRLLLLRRKRLSVLRT